MTEPLYDTDFYQWTQTQAAALRAKGCRGAEYRAPGGGN